ncbi:MAG: hypothetical protein WEB06_12015 [Actinomycetota bacterium]
MSDEERRRIAAAGGAASLSPREANELFVRLVSFKARGDSASLYESLTLEGAELWRHRTWARLLDAALTAFVSLHGRHLRYCRHLDPIEVFASWPMRVAAGADVHRVDVDEGFA